MFGLLKLALLFLIVSTTQVANGFKLFDMVKDMFFGTTTTTTSTTEIPFYDEVIEDATDPPRSRDFVLPDDNRLEDSTGAFEQALYFPKSLENATSEGANASMSIPKEEERNFIVVPSKRCQEGTKHDGRGNCRRVIR